MKTQRNKTNKTTATVTSLKVKTRLKAGLEFGQLAKARRAVRPERPGESSTAWQTCMNNPSRSPTGSWCSSQ